MPNKTHAQFNSCFSSRLALLGSSTEIQACPLSRVSGSFVVGLRSRRFSKKVLPTGQSSLECQGTRVQVPRVFCFLAKRDQYKANQLIKASYQSVCTLASTPPGMPRTHPPILLRTFGYSRPILVALRSLSLKPISFRYKTPPVRFSQTGSQSSSPQP